MAIQAAHSALSNELASTVNTGNLSNKSNLGWISSFIHGLFESTKPTDDYAALEELKKTLIHLDTSLRNLSTIFNVSLKYFLEL